MKQKIKRTLWLIQLALILGGILISARPVYHLCKWQVNEILGKWTWVNHQSVFERTGAANGLPAVWLKIPGIELSTLVLYEASRENLRAYPCLETDGASLHGPGVKTILGHRDMHFRKLKDIEVGQHIYLELEDKSRQEYRVLEIEILQPEQVIPRIREKSGEDWLVLVTCYPFKYVGSAPQRFLVWSRPCEEKQ